MMRNYVNATLNVKRIDICDLMIACLVAKDNANDDGKKWDKLHDLLKSQLDDLDKQIDIIENAMK